MCAAPPGLDVMVDSCPGVSTPGYKDFAPNKDNLRETFFQNQLLCSHAIRVPEKGDFLTGNRFTFEIGGKQKTHHQIADLPDSFAVRDDMECPAVKTLPLWLFGLMYGSLPVPLPQRLLHQSLRAIGQKQGDVEQAAVE